MRKLTSAGSDNGAPPIRDLHCEVLEKGLAEALRDSAGTRKSGSGDKAPQQGIRDRPCLMIMVCVCW